MSEALVTFLVHNMRCEVRYVAPWQIVEGQTETEIQCSVDSGATAWQVMDETIKEPDFLWKHVPFRVLWAGLAEKDGLTMWLAFPRSDYATLSSELQKEWGEPHKDTRLNKQTVVWENAISRLQLQLEAGSGDNTSIAMLHQTKYLEGVLLYMMQKKIAENSEILKRQGK